MVFQQHRCLIRRRTQDEARFVRSVIRIQAWRRGHNCRKEIRPIAKALLQRLQAKEKQQNSNFARSYLSQHRLDQQRQTGFTVPFCQSPVAQRCNNLYGGFSGQHQSFAIRNVLENICLPPRVKIFQASPLACRDETNFPKFLSSIDLRYERETITKALQDSNLSADFQIATIGRFTSLLSRDDCRAIHFSCHGHQEYLAFEDGWGEMVPLKTCKIKEMITRGGSKLHFVFVSSCHSMSIGKTFAEAGVPHVVCCDVSDQSLLDAAAMMFTKTLYQGLAWGKTLQEAFDLAREELSIYQIIDRSQGFCLLPENGNHDVPIFSKDPQGPSPVQSENELPDLLPVQSDNFVRDDLEMYRTLQAVKYNRLVRLIGPAGIGKATLAKECCTYLSECDRLEVVDIDDIAWKSVDPNEQAPSQRNADVMASSFWKLSRQWLKGSSTSSSDFHCRDVIEYFKEKRSLLVIEAKKLKKEGILLMHSFLKQLIEDTNKHLKVLVIYNSDMDSDILDNLPSAFDINVESLNIESTVKLFATCCKHVQERTICRHVGEAGDLWRLLLPGQTVGSLSKRLSAILKMLGGSNPKNVCIVAQGMSSDEYLTLVELGLYRDLDLFQTRAELLLLEFEVDRRIAFRRAREDDDGRLLLERKLKAIHRLKDEFQDARTLQSAWKKKYAELLRSGTENREMWFALQRELETLQVQIKKEEDAIVSWLTDSRCSSFSMKIKHKQVRVEEKPVFTTGSPRQDARPSSMALDLQVSRDALMSKHGIEACLKLMSKKSEKFKKDERFEKAAAVAIHLRLLQELHCLKSSVGELDTLSCQLEASVENCAASEAYEIAESANKLLDKVNCATDNEKKAMTRRRPSLSFSSRGLLKIAYPVSGAMEQCPRPPFHDSVLVAKNQKRKKEIFGMVDKLLHTLRAARQSSGVEDTNTYSSTRTVMTDPISLSSFDES